MVVLKAVDSIPNTTKEKKKSRWKPGVIVHTYNPSTMRAEVKGLQVQSQPGLHHKTLSQ
jgi:hypothetical protein